MIEHKKVEIYTPGINQCCEIEVEGSSRRERYKTWKGTVKAELRTRNLSEADIFDRKIWRKRV